MAGDVLGGDRTLVGQCRERVERGAELFTDGRVRAWVIGEPLSRMQRSDL